MSNSPGDVGLELKAEWILTENFHEKFGSEPEKWPSACTITLDRFIYRPPQITERFYESVKNCNFVQQKTAENT
ncbi:uncharacterized protein N7484_011655 [Penicillium longicatenatum]|uniref:uncharacterized protein n=1 Tax=Penicillium longicatenatum TaxID=1561947 RepID=UPI002549B706|nr:uncharacterized protein N7484_011655 [Penicillium longicatenatum]KAJ5631555.1 hypothetical protein N7484_011655 [Penicillium longicatenatum]